MWVHLPAMGYRCGMQTGWDGAARLHATTHWSPKRWRTAGPLSAQTIGSQVDLVVNDVMGLRVSTSRPCAQALALPQRLAKSFDLEVMGRAGADRSGSRSARQRVDHAIASVSARPTGPAAPSQEAGEGVRTETETETKAQTAPIASPCRTSR